MRQAVLAAAFFGFLAHADVSVQPAVITQEQAQASDDIFKKPVLPRVTLEKVQAAGKRREESFDTAKNMKYLLIPAGIIAAGAVAYNWNSVRSMTKSGAKITMNCGRNVGNAGLWVVNCVPRAFGWNQFGYWETVSEATGAVAPLSEDEIQGIRNMLSEYVWWAMLGGLTKGIAKDYMWKGAERVRVLITAEGAQDIRLFLSQSTKLSKIKSDFRGRYQRLQDPQGGTTLEHYRQVMFEMNENLINDATRVIAFMHTLNSYNELAIESVETQLQMLMDEANDVAALLEYKFDEFDHTADKTKRQALLKEMIVASMNFLNILEMEVNGFAILINPDQE